MLLRHCIFVKWFQLSQTSVEIVWVVLEKPHPHCPPPVTISMSGFHGKKEPVRRKYLLASSLEGKTGNIDLDVREAGTCSQPALQISLWAPDEGRELHLLPASSPFALCVTVWAWLVLDIGCPRKYLESLRFACRRYTGVCTWDLHLWQMKETGFSSGIN